MFKRFSGLDCDCRCKLLGSCGFPVSNRVLATPEGHGNGAFRFELGIKNDGCIIFARITPKSGQQIVNFKADGRTALA